MRRGGGHSFTSLDLGTAGAAEPSSFGPARCGPNLVLLGEFGRPHGLRGEVRLKSYTDDPRGIASYGPLLAADGRRFVITHARAAAGEQADLLVVRLEGVGTREAAEALNRLPVHVERDRLGQPEEDEFYLADLVGLRVETSAGAIVGSVAGVPNFGGGELLEIAPFTGGRTLLLPFTKAFVPVVDVAGGRLVIEPPPDFFAEAAVEPT